jgi:hypothetical protein
VLTTGTGGFALGAGALEHPPIELNQT